MDLVMKSVAAILHIASSHPSHIVSKCSQRICRSKLDQHWTTHPDIHELFTNYFISNWGMDIEGFTLTFILTTMAFFFLISNKVMK
jgi:hypothetical protein